MTALRREFRPPLPRWRESWPTALLTILLILFAGQRLVGASPRAPALLGGTALLWSASVYLLARHRFPGRPVLILDADGIHYRRFGSLRSLAWPDVAEIRTDATLGTLIVVSGNGNRRLTAPLDMVASDGTHWSLLVHTYWQPR